MRQRGLNILLSILAMVFSIHAFAGQPGPAPNPYVPQGGYNEEIMPWIDSKTGNTKEGYQDCGQNCVYHKANENLSLQSRYIKNLAVPSPGASLSPEETVGVVKQLRVIRAGIGSNERNIQNLQGDPDDIKATFLEKKDENLKPADIPYVQTSDALARDMVRRSRNDKTFKDAVNPGTDWNKKAQDLVKANAPKLEDFPLFVQVPRDKSNPGGEKIWVQKVVNGVPQYDRQMFETEKLAFEQKYGTGPAADSKLTQLIHDRKDAYVQSLKDLSLKPIGAKGEAPKLKEALSPSVPSGSAMPAEAMTEAFKKARAEVVKAANEGIKKESGKGLTVSSGAPQSSIPVVNDDGQDSKLLGVSGATPGYHASVSVIDSDLLESDKETGKSVDKDFKNYLSHSPTETNGVVADVAGSKPGRNVATENKDQIEIKGDDKKAGPGQASQDPQNKTQPVH